MLIRSTVNVTVFTDVICYATARSSFIVQNLCNVIGPNQSCDYDISVNIHNYAVILSKIDPLP